MTALVLQSCHEWPRAGWRLRAMESVRAWAAGINAAYRFLDDALFDPVPGALRARHAGQPVVLTDLARLMALEQALAEGYEAAVWLDSDVFVAAPHRLFLPDGAFLPGREVWVQADRRGRPKAYRKVHNAALLVRPGGATLAFYREAAGHMLARAEPPLVPQFIGPKFLSALHNMVGFDVWDGVGMLSPLALRDAARGGGPALARTLAGHDSAPAAVNLSASMIGRGSDGVRPDAAMMDAAMDRLPALLG
ncbi:hypothetical protein [Yunchengibacter salinarum]|uniref:hypothetical protein n=1 Tax=Yunchengibacter salinarum TaxID=3133399 RepID=UPI0035B646FA